MPSSENVPYFDLLVSVSSPLSSLLCDSLNDGAALAFVSCVAPKLASTPMCPLYSRLAVATLSLCALLIFSVLYALERVLVMRVTLTLEAQSRESEERGAATQDERERESHSNSVANSTNSGPLCSKDAASISQPVTPRAPPVRDPTPPPHPPSPFFITKFVRYLLRHDEGYVRRFVTYLLRHDEGCVRLCASPLVSLLLISLTALLLLQLVLLSTMDPRRVSVLLFHAESVTLLLHRMHDGSMFHPLCVSSVSHPLRV